MIEERYYESLEAVERIAYGMLRLSERDFKRLTLKRIIRAMEWFKHEDEAREEQTRLICYYQGNHKAKTPQDLWLTSGEIARKQREIINGNVPLAQFKKLSEEEVKKWRFSKN